MSPCQGIPAFVGLGANLGDPERNLEQAREAMAALKAVRLGAVSPIYLTEPQDIRDQPWFANQVVRLHCGPDWTAEALLAALLGIEDRMGRVREQEKGPRLIDLDLLLFGKERRTSPDLILPHPRIQDRAFVLIPLLDIAPDLSLPDGTRLTTARDRLTFQVHGRRIAQA